MTRATAAAEQLRLAESALAGGRFPEAIELLRAVSRMDRDSPRPRLMLAYALARGGQAAEAINVLRRLIERLPGNADAWFNLGNLLRLERRLQEAARAFRRAAFLRPGDPNAEVNLGYVLVQLGQFDEAERSIRSSLQRLPDEPDLLVNLAQIQRATGRWDDAVAALDRCVELAPRHAGYRVTRAIALGEAGHEQRALADLTSLLEAEPQNAEAHLARSHLLLSNGEYRAGWEDYQWRPDRLRWLRAQGKPVTGPTLSLESLSGRGLVLCGEQGLGDTLFFLRFAPALAEVAASVGLDVDERLRAILLPAEWIGEPDQRTLHILVGDLPIILGCGATPSVRLTPEVGRIARFRERLSLCGPPPYIGVTWQGGFRWEEMPIPGERLFKRVAPSQLGEALRPVQGTLVSLQRQAPAGELEAVGAAAQRTVHDFSSVNQDLADALALLYALNDYVAVSNTNVHLNEALGKRTRALVTAPAEWRWMTNAERSPWFANARLYRQDRDGSWGEALARLTNDIAKQSLQ
jgi:Flp pilus assembly protein TadD